MNSIYTLLLCIITLGVIKTSPDVYTYAPRQKLQIRSEINPLDLLITFLIFIAVFNVVYLFGDLYNLTPCEQLKRIYFIALIYSIPIILSGLLNFYLTGVFYHA